MSSTQAYEYLLECENVIGVDYDEAENRVTVFVSQKRPRDCLSDEDDVEARVAEAGDDVDISVVDSGFDEKREGFDALSTLEPMPEAAEDRRGRHRPVPAGVSEINANSTAGTGGPYPARVEDVTGGTATWDDGVEAGDLVRLSNNHVYARSDTADFGEPILQPSPVDGGDAGDEVGVLVGTVPIEDGSLVDVAARSVDSDRESAAYAGLDEEWPTGVRREGYDDLRGATVTKTGRTTGVTSAAIEATSASVRVEFPDQGPVLLRDQLVTGPMSEPGDSGSPVFLADGTLVGLLFAGSSRQTICNRIANVERELGVEILAAEPGDDEGVPVYRTTVDRELEVDLAEPSLALESVVFEDELRPGETVDIAATVAGDPGRYWLEIADDRAIISIPDGDGSRGRATARLPVSVPDDATGSLTVRLRGGPVATLE